MGKKLLDILKAVACIAFLTVVFVSFTSYEVFKPRKGYELVLDFERGVSCFFNGNEVTPEQWQELMETKIDGKVGYKTLQKAVELNDLDVRRFGK